MTVDGWHEVACDFSLAEVPEMVSLAFVCDQGFEVRLDDVALSTGEGGVTVDLAGGGEIERAEPPVEPPAERTVTVSEIVGMIPASTGRVVADEESDMLFHAVVQNDFAGGNNAAATLVVAEEGAVNAGCGISCQCRLRHQPVRQRCGERYGRLGHGRTCACTVDLWRGHAV